MSGAPGASPLFRPQALETAGGDDYDRALRVLAPRSRAAGWFLVAVAFAALVWSGFTEVPVKVAGNGILVTPDGVVDVVPAHPGRLQELLVRSGDHVAAGAAVARLEQADLQLELDLTRAALVDTEDQEHRITAFQVTDAGANLAFAVASGLRWSSGRGPAFAVNSGTMCEARVTVRQVRLLGLAIPAFQGAVDTPGETAR